MNKVAKVLDLSRRKTGLVAASHILYTPVHSHSMSSTSQTSSLRMPLPEIESDQAQADPANLGANRIQTTRNAESIGVEHRAPKNGNRQQTTTNQTALVSPSPSLSNRENASLNSAICSSEYSSVMMGYQF